MTTNNTRLEGSRYYGRRSARRLTSARVGVLKAALSRYEVILPPDCTTLEVQPPLWLEIGFGSGEHLLELAKRHPETSFIGCEPFLNGVAVLVRELQAQDIANVRIFAEDARLLLQALPNACIGRCFVLFADPWPKSRHHRRRMISPDTLDQFARVLQPGGELLLATDHADLAKWYEQVIGASERFEFGPAAGGDDPHLRPADWPETRYERKALASGRTASWWRAVRRTA